MYEHPLIAITMGDPGGIGPEVVLKALSHQHLHELCRPLVIGDADLLERANRELHLELQLQNVLALESLDPRSSGSYLVHAPGLTLETFQTGVVTAENGRASLNYIEKAIELALSGRVAAIATAPINKASLHLAGSPYRGHTRLLADRCKVEHVTMMLLTPGRQEQPQWLRVTHATTHIPLKEVPVQLTPPGLLSTIQLTHESLQLLGLDRKRIAVAGLNPHAGDAGLMGEEEVQWINPFVQQCRDDGFDVHGPLPADTVFLRAVQGEFDAVVALYHDQGHIPVKMHGFENAVNLTLGLPIIRTSVDHGTAFDIAWQGRADEASMVAAIELAADLASKKTSTRGER
jgi:4-hydroxythreonine-4-phosphate dehydrogenase